MMRVRACWSGNPYSSLFGTNPPNLQYGTIGGHCTALVALPQVAFCYKSLPGPTDPWSCTERCSRSWNLRPPVRWSRFSGSPVPRASKCWNPVPTRLVPWTPRICLQGNHDGPVCCGSGRCCGLSRTMVTSTSQQISVRTNIPEEPEKHCRAQTNKAVSDTIQGCCQLTSDPASRPGVDFSIINSLDWIRKMPDELQTAHGDYMHLMDAGTSRFFSA